MWLLVAVLLLASRATYTLTLAKCCPSGETLGTSERRPCVPSDHRLLHPFRAPPLYHSPGEQVQPQPDYSLVYGRLPPCRLLYYLEPDREPAEAFWLLADGTVSRAGEGPLAPGNYCLEAIPAIDRVVPVLCFPEGQVEGAGVYAVYPVGMFLSIPFLASTILVYTIFKELRNLHGCCLVCHVACLLCGYVCLAAIQIDTTAFPYYMCIVMGYAIQFFFMATFFWLNVMCFDIYWAFSGLRSLTGSVKDREKKKLIFYSIYAWGFPLLILLVTLAIDYSPLLDDNSVWKPNIGQEKCYFKDDHATGIFFYLPMGLIIIINMILFTITAFRIRSLRRETKVLKGGDSRKHDNTRKDKERFSLYLKLFVVMGINWVMELISFLVGGPSYLWYISDFTNTLQGLFIFGIFVWKRRVRRLIWTKIQTCCGKPPISNGSKTPWSGSTRYNNSQTNSSGVSANSMKMQPVSTTPAPTSGPEPRQNSITSSN